MVVAGSLDAALLAALHGQAGDEPWATSLFESHLDLPGTFARVAAVGEVPAGFVLSRVAVDEQEILMIAVTSAMRRRGVGKRLLTAATDAGRRLGARRLVLEVAIDNIAARGLYEAAGLAAVGRRPKYYSRDGGPVDALILATEL